MSSAHDDDVIDTTLERLDDAMRASRDAETSLSCWRSRFCGSGTAKVPETPKRPWR
jgi:hypothetical protein